MVLWLLRRGCKTIRALFEVLLLALSSTLPLFAFLHPLLPTPPTSSTSVLSGCLFKFCMCKRGRRDVSSLLLGHLQPCFVLLIGTETDAHIHQLTVVRMRKQENGAKRRRRSVGSHQSVPCSLSQYRFLAKRADFFTVR